MLRAADVRRAGRSRCWPTPTSPLPQEPPWSPGATRRWASLARGAPARRRRRPGRRAVRRSRRRRAAHGEHRHARRSARPSSRVLAMDRGRWDEAADTSTRASPPSTSTGCTTTPCSVLAFAAAARLAVHRGDLNEANRQLTARDAGPPVVHLRAAVARGAGSACSSPRCTGRSATTRRRATCCARSTTSSCTGPRSAPSSTRSPSSADASTRPQHDRRAPARPPLTPAELRLLPYLQTHLTIREIGERLFVSRNTVSSAGQLDLPQARRLVPQRRRPTGHGDRPARRLGTRSAQQVDGVGHREPERRQDPDELSAVLVRLGHHRVREHGEDRPGREGQHEGDDARRVSSGRARSRRATPGPRPPRWRSTSRGSWTSPIRS